MQSLITFNLNLLIMKKNSLTPNKGLSLSQAQSISNLCNQRAGEIGVELTGVNNYSKSVDVYNNGDKKTHKIVVGKKLPTNVVDLLKEKSKLHGCQGFLMENIKAKDALLTEARNVEADLGELEAPERPKIVSPLINMLPEVTEKKWGWEQLTVAELNEFTEAEAYAAHIGQFIHNGGTLDSLRRELPTVDAVEWMTIQDGVKSPVTVEVHHKSEDLLKTHEELAALHRGYEQRVNYFKAKVKNLVTKENARIANINADAQSAAETTNNESQSTYDTAYKAYNEKVKTIRAEFEKERQAKIAEIAGCRISVDARFQDTVDVFLNQLEEKK